MPVKLQRNVIVRSKFLTRKNDLTDEISAVISPNRFQVGLSGSLSSPFASDLTVYGPGKFHGGVSGSLTQLIDGTSYIVAGPNMTITSASNGSVTISQTAGTAGPAGANTNIQFNDSGIFGGNADFIFNKSNGDVRIGGTTGTSELQFRDANQRVYSPLANTLTVNAPLVGLTGSANSSVAIQMLAPAGGIDIDAVGSAGEDINITNTGGSVNIKSTEDIINAIALDSPNIYFHGGSTAGMYAFYTKPLYLNIISNPTVRTGKLWNSSGNILNWGGLGFHTSGSAHFNVTTADYDFQVESSNKTHALFVDGGTDQVLVLSGGAVASFNEAGAGDVNFYVSGSIGSRASSDRGTTLFGGDLVTSGNLHVYADSSSTADRTLVTIENDNSAADRTLLLHVKTDATNDPDGTGPHLPAVLIETTAGDTGEEQMPLLELRNSNAGTTGYTSSPMLKFNRSDTTSEADDMDIGRIVFGAADSANADTTYAQIMAEAVDVTNGAEAGALVFQVHTSAGTGTGLRDLFTIRAEDAAAGTQCEVIVNDISANCDFRVESDGEDEALFVDASANTLFINRGATDFLTVIKNTNDEVLAIKSAGLVINENGNAGVDTRVETNNKTHAVFVDAGTDQVLILSGGAVTSTNEAVASDVAFYVSGSKGSAAIGSDERGASLFGGDVVISGSLYLKDVDPGGTADPQLILHRISPSAAPDDILGSITFSGQDDGGVVQAYSSITGEINDETGGTEDGVITFKIAKSATLRSVLELKDNEAVFNNDSKNIDFRVESDAKAGAIYLDAANDQMALLAVGSSPTFGNDTALLVSGSIGSRGKPDAGTAVFRGDVYTSGSLHISGSSTIAADIPKLSVGCSATTPPKTALDVTYDYKTHDFTNLLAAGEGGGDRLRLGVFAAGVTTAGRIYYYSAGTWRAADADNVNTMQLLGIALDVDGGVDEGLVLLKGFVRVAASSVVNGAGSSADLGDPVYVSTTSSKWDFTAPSAGGDYKRFIGYCLDRDSSSGDYLMWFNPDNYTQAL